MPIEIKELHLRMVVNAPPAKQASAVQDKAGAGDSGDKDAIVAECVEQVLQILQTKKER